MQVAASHAAVGPRLFPFLVAGGLILVAAALLREAFFGHVAHEGGFELDWLAVLLVSAGLIVQMLLLEWVGWIVAATILFVLTARAFMSRRLVADAALGVGLAGTDLRGLQLRARPQPAGRHPGRAVSAAGRGRESP